MKKCKVALVNAPPLGVVEPWYDTPEFPRGALAALAGYLLQYSYIEVICIDAKFEKLSFDETIRKILNFDADVVGFTAFTNEIKPCAYIAHKIKEKKPKVINVVGGAHPSALPEITLKQFPAFDIVAIGDGEETIYEICEYALGYLSLSAIRGICFRENNAIVKNHDRARILNQDALPMPAWNLMPRGNHYWLQSAKGCPFNCVFCMNHNGKVVRKNGIEKTMDEIQFVLDNYHPEWIRFGDELFTADRNRTLAFLKAWIERGFQHRVKWDVQTHVAYVDDEMLQLFKQANITQLDMGIESGDNAVLKKMGKGTTEEMIIQAFQKAHKYGIKTGSLLLLGQPNETIESMKKTVDMAIKINSALPMFGVMMPLPGTEVAKMAAMGTHGYKNLNTNWDEYRKNVGVSVEFQNFTRADIDKAQFWGFVNVFLHNHRYLDFLNFIWKYKTEGWNNVKKILFKKKSIKDYFDKMPADYEYVMSLGEKFDALEIVTARENFNKIQIAELKRTKADAPYLLQEQMPLKTPSKDNM